MKDVRLTVTLIALVGTTAQPGGGITCTTTGDFSGLDTYKGSPPYAAPLRGSVGCVDAGPLFTRPTTYVGGQTQDAVNIYGPMEAGFTSQQFSCLGTASISGGIDTHTAERMTSEICGSDEVVLDYCGGHAAPYHYHESMDCLYSADPSTQHSTRIGTAGDGNGIYGHNIDGGLQPTDLDACGGRTGITPDSAGQSVYYYVVTGGAPFTLGCFGPATLAECRLLYSTCDGDGLSITTEFGTGMYDLDCPCFDSNGSNMPGATTRPDFLAPLSAGNGNGESESSVGTTTNTTIPGQGGQGGQGGSARGNAGDKRGGSSSRGFRLAVSSPKGKKKGGKKGSQGSTGEAEAQGSTGVAESQGGRRGGKKGGQSGQEWMAGKKAAKKAVETVVETLVGA